MLFKDHPLLSSSINSVIIPSPHYSRVVAGGSDFPAQTLGSCSLAHPKTAATVASQVGRWCNSVTPCKLDNTCGCHPRSSNPILRPSSVPAAAIHICYLLELLEGL